MNTGEANNVRVAVSVSLSFVNGTMSNSNTTTAETVTPYTPFIGNGNDWKLLAFTIDPIALLDVPMNEFAVTVPVTTIFPAQ